MADPLAAPAEFACRSAGRAQSNPVAIAAALATMDVLEREGIANAAAMGDVFFSRLRDWPAKHPVVGDVRGRGLMIGIEIVKSQQTREPAPVLRDRIERAANDAAQHDENNRWQVRPKHFWTFYHAL